MSDAPGLMQGALCYTSPPTAVRLLRRAPKLKKFWCLAEENKDWRAIVEGFAEENLFSRRLRKQQEAGVIVKWQHEAVKKSPKV